MLYLKWILFFYSNFILAYLLNVLITELPLDNRYKKLKRHFSLKRFFSLAYFPLLFWFSSAFKSYSISLKIRHVFVLLISFLLFFTHLFGFTLLHPIFHFVVFLMLTICLFTDLEHQIIPNEISFGLIFVGLTYSVLKGDILSSFQGIFIVILVFSIFSLIMLLFGQSHAFGAGDIKLCIGIGSLWGWQITIIMLYFTFLIGGVVGLYFLLIKRRSADSYYPFAPVIILGLLVALIYTDNIFDYYYPWVNNSFKVEKLERTKFLPKL